MRLQKLIMQAFGPFKDRIEINFESEKIDSGLLLISGETGSGKTSIFDAISYVLYGESSGEQRTEKTLRSEYADDDTESFVQLFFEHRGTDYEIRRKLNSSGTKGYYIVGGRIDEQGKEKVTNAVKSILGLDAKQFHQVVMLAQSEFTKLMDADSIEKTKLFRKIFNTDIYFNIACELESRTTVASGAVAGLKNKIDDRKKSLEEMGFDCLPYEGSDYFSEEGIIKALEDRVVEKEGDQVKLNKEKNDLNEKYEKIITTVTEQKSINDDLSLLEKHKEDRDIHLKNNTITEEDRKKCDYYLKVQDIRTFKEQLEDNIGNEKKAVEDLKTISEEYDNLNNEYLKHSEEYKLLDTFEENNQKLSEEKDKIEDYLRSLNEYKGYADAIAEQKREKNIAEQNLEAAKAEYEAEKRKYDHSVSYKLAVELNEGDPCPVCGSTHHPSLADKPEDCLDEKEIRELEKKKNGFEVAISTATKLIDENIIKQSDLKLGDIADIENEINTCKKNLSAKESEISKLKSENERISKLKNNYEIDLAAKKSSKEGKKENLNSIREQRTSLEEKIQNAFRENDTNEEEYNKLLLKTNEYQSLHNKIKEYDDKLNTYNIQIKMLEDKTSGKSFVDISALELERDELKIKKDSLDNEISALDSELRLLKEHKKKLEEYCRDYITEKENYDLLNKISSYALGKNGSKRISLENYVQSYYLDEVLSIANRKLITLTDGELVLDKKEESIGNKNFKDNRLGVEFMVRSTVTDKVRRPKDISGGEKFKVALSLALGISEVISINAGGVQMDSLFIDEGFGHLDSESLNKAYLILKDISASSNKLIGIISHVEALKAMVDNKIEVKKESYGSSLTINSK